MSNSYKNTAYSMIQNRHPTTDSERGDDSCDELLIDIEETAEAVAKSNSEKMMQGNVPQDKQSEANCQNYEDLLPRNNPGAQGINDFSELGYVDEISDKFSKLNTSSRISDSFVLNPSTCHSDHVEALEQKYPYVLNMKTNIKSKQHEQFQASPCFKTHELSYVSETPYDFCTKFKTLLGSNEKLITLDNVRDIKFKSINFSELNCHGFTENKQHMQVSKTKDISDINFVKSDTRISSKSGTCEMSEKYKGANSASNSCFRFNKNTLYKKDKTKIRTENPNLRTKEKCAFNFVKDFNEKTSNQARQENASKRPNLKHKRYSLPFMQGSPNNLDTMQFDQMKSIPFGLPNPNELANCKNRESTKKSRKRRASSSIANMHEVVKPASTSSTKRRTNNPTDEPSAKFRKRGMGPTDAETADSRHSSVRSSSYSETR